MLYSLGVYCNLERIGVCQTEYDICYDSVEEGSCHSGFGIACIEFYVVLCTYKILILILYKLKRI